MRIAIIGADGQLGTDIHHRLNGKDIHPLFYPDFDITKKDEFRNILLKMSPDLIINTAAYNRVDEAENEVEEVFALNSKAVKNLAEYCLATDCILMHFSTDYVFDGKKNEPYIESDCPNPLNVYGHSKLSGEHFIQSLLNRYYLVRTSCLFGMAGCKGKGANFIDTITFLSNNEKEICVVNDQVISPTSTHELSKAVEDLIQTNQFGLYHLSNEGQCTWYELAQAVSKTIDSKVKLIPVTTEDFGAKANRPSFSVLENFKAKQKGFCHFSNWESALDVYLNNKLKSS